MKVCRIEEKHIPGIARLERLCFAEPWSEDSLRLLLKDGAVGFVCENDNGQVCAYGGMLCVLDEAQVTDIATDPNMRRRGYAEAVVGAMMKYAAENNITSVSLEVRESNVAAVKLYEKSGFRCVGRRPSFYRQPTEAALVMVAQLADRAGNDN